MLFGVVMLASLLFPKYSGGPVAYGSLDRLPGSYRWSSLPPDEAQFLG
jgi:hypothetical protein